MPWGDPARAPPRKCLLLPYERVEPDHEQEPTPGVNTASVDPERLQHVFSTATRTGPPKPASNRTEQDHPLPVFALVRGRFGWSEAGG